MQELANLNSSEIQMTINPTTRFTDIIVPMQIHDSTLLISCNVDTFNTKDKVEWLNLMKDTWHMHVTDTIFSRCFDWIPFHVIIFISI